MAGSLWEIFCGNSLCDKNRCSSSTSAMAIFYPYSCVNHIMVISTDILLMLIYLFLLLNNLSLKNYVVKPRSRGYSVLPLLSSTLIGGLGLAYLSMGIRKVLEKASNNHSIIPVHEWLELLFQGFTWSFLGLTFTFRRQPCALIEKLSSILTTSFAAILCISSIWQATLHKETSRENLLNMLIFPGATLMLFRAFWGQNCKSTESITKNDGDAPSKGIASREMELDETITPFAKAGYFSMMSFGWLNPLLKRGKKKIFEDKDIPKLRHTDRAESCYVRFMDKLTEQKEKESPYVSPILSTIFIWQQKEIVITGFFALTKVLALTTGPLLLKAFIRLALGKEDFKHEGYVLTVALFLGNSLESVSNRQWSFRSKLIGLRVKSMLSAAIYQKQLRLSNDAKITHSPGQIMNYVIVDANKIGEFPYWLHQIWTTILQLCLAILIIYCSVGLATLVALLVIVTTVTVNYPVGRLQHKYLTQLMAAQDMRLKAITEAVTNMKVLKLYAWKTHFKNVIQKLRKEESKYLSAFLATRGYVMILFWSSPTLVIVATFFTCYLIKIPLDVSNMFTFIVTVRLIQEPIRLIPDIAAAFLEASVALTRILKFLEAPELLRKTNSEKVNGNELKQSIEINSTSISWKDDPSKATLSDINLRISLTEKVAICGEVGSGKSTLIAAILGEVPNVHGTVQVYGKIAYVSQTAWIQTGTVQENILFGSLMDQERYKEVLTKCSLIKDLEMLPNGDSTIIGERGINLSGGQKQRVQLARALYQDADIYLLDDPFSAVDAHVAASLFKEYIMEALSRKTVLLITHQVDFLPAFDKILLMSEGKIVQVGTFSTLLESCKEFENLVTAHDETSGLQKQAIKFPQERAKAPELEIEKISTKEKTEVQLGDQIIKKEERESGDAGLKPYSQYLSQSNGFVYFFFSIILHMIYLISGGIQSLWLAAAVQDSSVSKFKLITVYMLIGCAMTFFLVIRVCIIVILGLRTSESTFSKFMGSLFQAPMSFYDSTPLGRILSRVSSDLSVVDLELAFKLNITLGSTMNTYFTFLILAVLTWPSLFVIIPTIYVTILLQRFYLVSARQLIRINGTTNSSVASHLAESIAGSMTIRAFREENRFFKENFILIDANASSFFHNFSAKEWLLQRLELVCAVVVAVSALAMTMFPLKASDAGFVGMTLAYSLSMNKFLGFNIEQQCGISNSIISMERIEQYLHIPSEGPETIEGHQPSVSWPSIGKVELHDLKVKYRPHSPLVLQGISCIFEGGHKIGVVGRTGSGKSTLISALFRLVEPSEGAIIIDGLDISSIGLHDLRSHLAIIPQEPTLFVGSVRYNLDPLDEHNDHEIWKVLEKCQLREVVQEKEEGLNSTVVQDGSNWSMGQRQLFCLGRALLKRRKILVLDEATASIDNSTDSIIQKTIREEFADCTVITVAHRIPTVMDSTKVLGLSDGKLIEYDEPRELMRREGSLFGKLVKEYWSQHSAGHVQE